MRGDSIRDFYAKGLALVGMGLLAGVGLLVDHWPVAVHLPHVASVVKRPVAAGPLAVGQIAPPIVIARRPPIARTVPVTTPNPQPEPTVEITQAEAVTPPETAPDALPAQPRPLIASPAIVADLGAPQVDFSRPSEPVLVVIDSVSLPPVGTPLRVGEPDGFFTGALKKTGGSIVKTGVKTGTIIGGALRGVGGAILRMF